jgi:hypothetical protein
MERLGRIVVLLVAWPVLAVGLWARRRPQAHVRPPPPDLDRPFLWVVAAGATTAGALAAAIASLALLDPRGVVALVLVLPLRAAQRRAIERWVASRA